jgi:hypothetical protein
MAKKKRTAPKTGKNKRAAARAKTTVRTTIDAMSAAQQQRVFRALRTMLKQQGVTNELSAVHFDTNIQPLLCQPPKVRRMVCRLIHGVPVCRPECVDP